MRNGMLHAAGDVVLFTDADLSSPIEEAAKLIDSIQPRQRCRDRLALAASRICRPRGSRFFASSWQSL